MAGEGRSGYSAKRGSNPLVAYSEVKVQVRDLVRVVGIVAVSVFGEKWFYREIRGTRVCV